MALRVTKLNVPKLHKEQEQFGESFQGIVIWISYYFMPVHELSDEFVCICIFWGTSKEDL